MDEKSSIVLSHDEAFKKKQGTKRVMLQCLSISAVFRLFTVSAYIAYRFSSMLQARHAFTKTDLTTAWTFFAIELSGFGECLRALVTDAEQADCR